MRDKLVKRSKSRLGKLTELHEENLYMEYRIQNIGSTLYTRKLIPLN